MSFNSIRGWDIFASQGCNPFHPWLPKMVIGGGGGEDHFKWKLNWGEKGRKESLINWKHLTKAIVNERGGGRNRFFIVASSLPDTKWNTTHDNHPSYLVATTELSSHTTLMHAATEQGNRLITTEQLLQQAIFCSVINDFAFFFPPSLYNYIQFPNISLLFIKRYLVISCFQRIEYIARDLSRVQSIWIQLYRL